MVSSFKQWESLFYHGSTKKLPEGTILVPNAARYTKGHPVEVILEKYRPANMLPRAQSIYMAKETKDIGKLGGYQDYIYVVEPQGKVESSDQGWYTEIDLRIRHNDDPNPLVLEEAAKNYWAGVPYKTSRLTRTYQLPPIPVIEYRTPAAKIIKLL
jgi:hypothetical protein